jgi:hypothetical protein
MEFILDMQAWCTPGWSFGLTVSFGGESVASVSGTLFNLSFYIELRGQQDE